MGLDPAARVMYMIHLASMDCVPQRAAIRDLYVTGYEVDWIAETCELTVPFVQNAINNIP